MTIAERRARDREAQRRLITRTARDIAQREGWDAVTTRRLSSEIEYSQPVIYKHFASLDEISDAVALEGFEELTSALHKARLEAEGGDILRAVTHRYAKFATDAPALYDAMFVRPSTLRFGDDSVQALATAFTELRQAIEPRARKDELDPLTEIIWAALHGLVILERDAKLTPGRHYERIDLMANRLLPARPSH